MTTSLEQIQLRRAEEQMVGAFRADEPRTCLPCGVTGCLVLIARYNKSGLCTKHIRQVHNRLTTLKRRGKV